ncbi:MAG: hypothetical protein GY901_00660, partial [Actinomycetia bacterium]|nr:hypothetical protein [Actinomycetes bacterium]
MSGSVSQIRFTLLDRHGRVDAEAVKTSISVVDSVGAAYAGQVSALNGLFTFRPDASPLPDGEYTVSFTAGDVDGNAAAHAFGFIVDAAPADAPVITGGTVTSGTLQVRPATNASTSASVILTGAREDDVAIWLDNAPEISYGSGDWSIPLDLPQGDNTLEFRAVDRAGNLSLPVWVDLLVDSIAPTVDAVSPADNAFLAAPLPELRIDFTEATSGLDASASAWTIQGAGGGAPDGTWVATTSTLVFTPVSPLPDDAYTVAVQLVDNLGNHAELSQTVFSIKTTIPPVPVIDSVITPTRVSPQTITGAKEAYDAILLNGEPVTAHTLDTTWSHPVDLVQGLNTLTFAARDRAGNQSDDATVEIAFDQAPPLPVAALTADGAGSGTVVALDWSGYDEASQGDIAFYRIYMSISPLKDLTGLPVHDTVPAGLLATAVGNLTEGTLYYFTVVAVDHAGNAGALGNVASAAPTDAVAPGDVANARVVQCLQTSLTIAWDPSADADGDLVGYTVYVDDA